jgi:hypothetical protein
LVQGFEQLTPETELPEDAYRLELPTVYGEEADLLLDESGEVVAVECSLGSIVSIGMTDASRLLGSGIDPNCVDGFLTIAMSDTRGVIGRLAAQFQEAFDANKLFPQSNTDKPFAQLAKGLGIENFSAAAGSLQGIVDKVALPPAGDGVVSVTPPKKNATDIAKLLTGVADGYQLVNQAASSLQTLVQGFEQLTPETP